MTIDATIPLMVKAPDINTMLDQGSKYAEYFTKLKSDSELSRIYKESNGDLNKMLEIGKQSPMARWVMPQLQAQQAALQKQALEQQKTQSEIYKNIGAGGKDYATAGKTAQETANARLSEAKRAIFAGAQNGNPQFIKMGLDAAKASGAIDDQTYAQFNQQLDGLGGDTAKVSEWAKNAILAGSQNPASFLFQSADNAANNETAKRGQDITANTAAAEREQKGKQFNQTMSYKEAKDAYDRKEGVVKQFGNKVYFIDKFGNPKYIPDLPPNPQKGGSPKLSDNALKQVNEATTQLSQAKMNYQKIGGLVNDLNSGKMSITPQDILGAKGRSFIGKSNENDLKINQFQTTLNQAANDVLMLAKGTQTEGDAKRAVQTIMANPPRDKASALQVLNTLAGIQRNTINTLNGNINTIYDNYQIPRPNQQQSKSGASNAKTQASDAKLKNILFGH